MDKFIKAALDYIPQFLDYQMRASEQPGCSIAIAYKGKVVLERAFGSADLGKGEALTPRHRFRVASHSKSFTAAGVMRLREESKLKLDDRIGHYVEGLHKDVARATVAQLLSHSAGIIRDGGDNGQWLDRRPFLNERELRAALAKSPILPANTRFKYSNQGYGLIGLAIEAITGRPYARWIKSTVIAPAGLTETTPDMPLARGVKLAKGHSAKLPLGRRAVVPSRNLTHALAPATGFVSTAADLARFFAQIDPAAKNSFLSVESRREMVRRQWRSPHSTPEQHYGLGTMSGTTAGWDWAGHSGGFQGTLTRSGALLGRDLSFSILTNSGLGWSAFWVESVINILASFARNGAPSRRTANWAGRWWTLWGATDLVPMGEKVLLAAPALFNPFMDASELAVTGRDKGRITLANGFASHGEPVRRVRAASGRVSELWLAGTKLMSEARVAAEMEKRYGTAAPKRRRRK